MTTKNYNMDTQNTNTMTQDNKKSTIQINHKQYTNLVDACWTHLQHYPEDQEVLKTIQDIMSQVMG